MKEIKLKLNKLTESRPNRSGYYIIVYGGCICDMISYSKKHDAFNALDEIENEHPLDESKITYWAERANELIE